MTLVAAIRPLCRTSPVCLALVMLLLTAATAAADTVRVLVEGALVWSRPGTGIITQMPRGTRLDVIRQTGEWFEIVIPVTPGLQARSGYIRAAQVEVVARGPLSPEAQRVASLPNRGGAPLPGTRRAPDRFLNVDVGYRTGGEALVRTAPSFLEYAEEGSIETGYGKGKGPQLDIMASQAMWGRLGIGFGVSFYKRTEDATIHVEVPHPFFFDRPRSAEAQIAAPEGRELGLHIPIVYVLRSDAQMRLLLYGGPSFYRISQDVITAVDLDDVYPYDEVAVVTTSGLDTKTLSAMRPGFHVGADVAKFFSRQVGVGGGVRFSKATITFADDTDGTVTGSAGGLQISAGLRVRF